MPIAVRFERQSCGRKSAEKKKERGQKRFLGQMEELAKRKKYGIRERKREKIASGCFRRGWLLRRVQAPSLYILLSLRLSFLVRDYIVSFYRDFLLFYCFHCLVLTTIKCRHFSCNVFTILSTHIQKISYKINIFLKRKLFIFLP